MLSGSGDDVTLGSLVILSQDVHRVFPFGKGLDYRQTLPSAPVYPRWSAHSMLLPYVERGDFYAAINYQLPP